VGVSKVFADHLDLLAVAFLVLFVMTALFLLCQRLRLIAWSIKDASNVIQFEIVPFILGLRRGISFVSKPRQKLLRKVPEHVMGVGNIDAIEYLVASLQESVEPAFVSIQGASDESLAGVIDHSDPPNAIVYYVMHAAV
jgi:hypothetical protein